MGHKKIKSNKQKQKGWLIEANTLIDNLSLNFDL